MFKVSYFYQKVHNFLLCRPTIKIEIVGSDVCVCVCVSVCVSLCVSVSMSVSVYV